MNRRYQKKMKSWQPVYMIRFLDIAEGEGPGALSDIEFKYICGRVCKKCFLDYYSKEFDKDL